MCPSGIHFHSLIWPLSPDLDCWNESKCFPTVWIRKRSVDSLRAVSKPVLTIEKILSSVWQIQPKPAPRHLLCSYDVTRYCLLHKQIALLFQSELRRKCHFPSQGFWCLDKRREECMRYGIEVDDMENRNQASWSPGNMESSILGRTRTVLVLSKANWFF